MTKENKKEKSKKFKILAASDTHGDTTIHRKMLEAAVKEDVDLVVIAGDFTENDECPEGFIQAFKDIGKEVMFVPGNHETEVTSEFLEQFYGIKNLHGFSVNYEGFSLMGCGGANIGLNQISEEDLFIQLEKANRYVQKGNRKIMVTHVHPSGSKIEKFTPWFKGSTGVTKAIYEFQPDVLICGHVHEAGGIEEKMGKTTIVNVSKTPKIIEIDKKI